MTVLLAYPLISVGQVRAVRLGYSMPDVFFEGFKKPCILSCLGRHGRLTRALSDSWPKVSDNHEWAAEVCMSNENALVAGKNVS